MGRKRKTTVKEKKTPTKLRPIARKHAGKITERPLLPALEQMAEKAKGQPHDWREAGLDLLQVHNSQISVAHLEKLRDAGLPTLGPLADRMENMGTDWSKGFRFRDETRHAIEVELAAIRAAMAVLAATLPNDPTTCK